MKQMKHSNDAVTALNQVTAGLFSKKMTPSVAREISNSQRQAISMLKLQLEYAVHRKETAHIPYLKTAEEKK